jgi:CubicO group peptidase (beta-lactamase class C family)
VAARTAALLTIAALCQPASADDLDRYIEQERSLYELPAVVLGVIRGGKLIDTRARGLANVELNVKVNPRHVFEIGSISKQFTAYAILILRDQGKLELEAPVGRYLTELPDAWARVSLHRLLTHTSGLPDLEEAFGYDIYRETPSDADFLRRLTALPLEHEPGEKWQYSNTNYWLLARVIEKIGATNYATFMQRHIFAPLGMTQTRSALPSQVLHHRAAGYRRVGSGLENRDAIQPNTGRGLGDIATSLADMAKWEREQQSPRLVSASTAVLARQPVVLNSGKQEPYGYGWSTEKILPRASLQHEGQTAGFSASYIRIPELRLAVVVFSNAYAAPTDSVARFALRRADPALRTARPKPIADTDPQTTARVTQLLSAAVSADTDWREEWFSPDYWRAIKPWLPEIAEFNRRLGPVRNVTLVSRALDMGAVTLTYRASHAKLNRLVTLRFDEQGRIGGRDAQDE